MIVMYENTQCHNWQLQANQTGISTCNYLIRLVNDVFKGCSYWKKHNVRIKSSAGNDHCLPWHKLKDDDATNAQLQLRRHDPAWPTLFWCDVWGCQDQWCVFCTHSLAACSTCCSQPSFNLANLEATVATKCHFSFHGSALILMMSNLCHNYVFVQVVIVLLIIFSGYLNCQDK